MRYHFLATLLLSLSVNCFGYVLNKGINGKDIRWTQNGEVLIYARTVNAYGMADQVVRNIVNNSVSQWNQASNKKIRVEYTNDSLSSGRNNLFFASDSVFFDSNGIAAVTQISYREEDGSIIKADIIVNDGLSYNPFTTSVSDGHYLGNAVAHELGHFLGLSHSQTVHATMFYKLKRGQHSLGADDKSGVNARYGSVSSDDFSIEGTTVGGKSAVAIFGAYVEAISQRTGKVIAGSVSDQDGKFKISGLSKNDQYSLYVSPLNRLDSLPLYYFSAKNNFCDSSKSFRGSFFTSCNSSGTGFPQMITSGGSSNVNVGSVTIRCSLDTPIGYLASKGSHNFSVNMFRYEGQEIQLGSNFIGHFSQLEASNREVDFIETNFGNYDFTNDSLLSNKNLFYHVKTVSQGLRSKIYLNMEVEDVNSLYPLPSSQDIYGLNYDSDGNPIIEINEYIPLVKNDPNIRIKILPKDPLTLQTDLGSRELYEEVFHGLADGFNEDMLFFNMIISVVELNSQGAYVPVRPRATRVLGDNLSCADAPNSYSVGGRIVASQNLSDVRNKKSSDDGAGLACGTVDFDNASGPGPKNGLMIIAFLFIFMLLKHDHLSRNQN